jgi:hypothetical protein
VAGAAPLARGLYAVAAGLLAAVTLVGVASPASTRAVVVTVDARDYAFRLSRIRVAAGTTVRFVVRNRGAVPHDFVISGKKRSRVLQPGQRQIVTVAFPRTGRFRFLCSVPGHARLGMRGSFGVSSPPAQQKPPTPPVDTSGTASLTRIGSFERPVLVTAPPGDSNRLFVVEQGGTVRVVRNGEVLPRPFLDLRDKVKVSSEPGLLSIAFAPDFAESGLFYAFYNSTHGNGDIHISEFRRHPTDPDLADVYTERILLTVVKPWENHNGGMLQFGPSGNLYASIGDGDSGVLNPPGHFAQRKDSLLGTIVRIDPRGDPYAIPNDNPFVGEADALPEIWAYGLRNPWRFWIDHETRLMYIADAGNERVEEVNVERLGRPGRNFGWPCFEGTLPFDVARMCEDPTPPLLEYPRGGSSCAVIGGVVVRDVRLAALSERYLFGDFCSGRITAVALDDGAIESTGDLGLVVPELTSFGVDGLRRIYVMSLRGDVYRLDPQSGT